MILRIALIFFLFCFFNLNIPAQDSGLNKIDVADLKRHLNFFASDSLQGRAFGTPVSGLDLAANYLKKNAREIGLVSGADDFFQSFPVISSKPDFENNFLEITDANGKSLYKTDSVIVLPSGSGVNISNAELVFAGFGFQDEKSGYDDFQGIDIRGKVVVFATGTPESFRKNELIRWDNSLETAKIEKATEAGAVLVLLVNNPLDESNSVFNRLSRWVNRNDFSLEIPENSTGNNSFACTTSPQADVLLGGSGKLKNLLAGIAEKQKPNSFPVKRKQITVNVNRKTEHFQAKNIIGIIEGSDPVLKDECVVFMAHYDHIGIDTSGNVFNGADDNGSGTVLLLEVAEAFMNLNPKPKRSIVFLWVTAEEVGLLGSQYYIQNPVFPVEKTVACFNIDMAGRVFEPRDTIWNKSAKMVKDFDGLYTLTNDIWPGLKEINSAACKTLDLIPDYSLPSSFLRSSDHFSFHRHGIPIINYSTGYHADYHKVTDKISRINFDKMKRVADLCFLVGIEIANREKIEFTKNESTN
jgi:hypothetical protein